MTEQWEGEWGSCTVRSKLNKFEHVKGAGPCTVRKIHTVLIKSNEIIKAFLQRRQRILDKFFEILLWHVKTSQFYLLLFRPYKNNFVK